MLDFLKKKGGSGSTQHAEHQPDYLMPPPPPSSMVFGGHDIPRPPNMRDDSPSGPSGMPPAPRQAQGPSMHSLPSLPPMPPMPPSSAGPFMPPLPPRMPQHDAAAGAWGSSPSHRDYEPVSMPPLPPPPVPLASQASSSRLALPKQMGESSFFSQRPAWSSNGVNHGPQELDAPPLPPTMHSSHDEAHEDQHNWSDEHFGSVPDPPAEHDLSGQMLLPPLPKAPVTGSSAGHQQAPRPMAKPAFRAYPSYGGDMPTHDVGHDTGIADDMPQLPPHPHAQSFEPIHKPEPQVTPMRKSPAEHATGSPPQRPLAGSMPRTQENNAVPLAHVVSRPVAMPPRPMGVGGHDGGPRYVDAVHYHGLIGSLGDLRKEFSGADTSLSRIHELETKKEAKFHQWQDAMEDVQRKLIFLDKSLFQQ